MDTILLQKLVDSDGWKAYEKGIRDEVKLWRILADQPGMDNDQRLYLYTKAQGLEESLNLIAQWLVK